MSTKLLGESGLVECDGLQAAHLKVFLALKHLSPDGKKLPRNRREQIKSRKVAAFQKALDAATDLVPTEKLDMGEGELILG